MRHLMILGLCVFGAACRSMTAPSSGELLVTKECSQYRGQAGDFCTITSSNLLAIKVGSKVVYASAAGATSLDSDIVIDSGPGDTAFGHVTLDLVTGLGRITFSRGTGRFTGFHASIAVSPPTDGVNWRWVGTYSAS